MAVKFPSYVSSLLIRYIIDEKFKPFFKFPKLKFFETSIFRFYFIFSFFSKFQKVKYPPHLRSNHLIFFSESFNGKSQQIL